MVDECWRYSKPKQCQFPGFMNNSFAASFVQLQVPVNQSLHVLWSMLWYIRHRRRWTWFTLVCKLTQYTRLRRWLSHYELLSCLQLCVSVVDVRWWIDYNNNTGFPTNHAVTKDDTSQQVELETTCDVLRSVIVKFCCRRCWRRWRRQFREPGSKIY